MDDSTGELLPSALLPFCSYQMDDSILGEKRPELSQTICNKFEPTVLEGQLCYSLDLAKTVKKSTKAGKSNGLLIMIDPSPYSQNGSNKLDVEEESKRQIKVFFQTLAQDTAYGPGTYTLSALKRMTGTESFEQLPDKQKRCSVHDRERCQTKKFLDQGKYHTYCCLR